MSIYAHKGFLPVVIERLYVGIAHGEPENPFIGTAVSCHRSSEATPPRSGTISGPLSSAAGQPGTRQQHNTATWRGAPANLTCPSAQRRLRRWR